MTLQVYKRALRALGAKLSDYAGPQDNAHLFTQLLRLKQSLVNTELLSGGREVRRRLSSGYYSAARPVPLSSKFTRVFELLSGSMRQGKVRDCCC